MWTYAQSVAAYHALPQEQLDFWQTIYQLHTRFGGPGFLPFLVDSRCKSPMIWFHYNCVVNDWLGLDPTTPRLFPGEADWSMMPDSVQGNSYWVDFPLFDQWKFPDGFCWEYPCPPRRVRKSYWTGIPRRRRNL